jgi:hypothetical protein
VCSTFLVSDTVSLTVERRMCQKKLPCHDNANDTVGGRPTKKTTSVRGTSNIATIAPRLTASEFGRWQLQMPIFSIQPFRVDSQQVRCITFLRGTLVGYCGGLSNAGIPRRMEARSSGSASCGEPTMCSCTNLAAQERSRQISLFLMSRVLFTMRSRSRFGRNKLS